MKRPRFQPSFLVTFTLFSSIVTIAIAGALAYLLQDRLVFSALEQAAASAADQVDLIIAPALRDSDLNALSPTKISELDALVSSQIIHRHIARIKIWNPQGGLAYSDDKDLIGQRFPLSDELKAALVQGKMAMDVSALNKPENVSERGAQPRLLEIYVPIRSPDNMRVLGAYEIYHDLVAVQPRIDELRNSVWLGVGGGFLILYLALFTIVRRASRELIRRSAETKRQADALAKLAEELQGSYTATLAAMSAALDARDRETEGHSIRVAALARQLARALGIHNERELQDIERGALLHDIGKIGVSDVILRKSGALTDKEWLEMKKHPTLGAEMLRGIKFLENAIPIVHYHQERWSGGGYPEGLKGESIPLWARLFAVVDVYDALISDRPYRKASPHDDAIEYLVSQRGIEFDPFIVDSFLQTLSLNSPPVQSHPVSGSHPHQATESPA